MMAGTSVVSWASLGKANAKAKNNDQQKWIPILRLQYLGLIQELQIL